MSEKVARMAAEAVWSPLNRGEDAFAVAPCAALRGEKRCPPTLSIFYEGGRDFLTPEIGGCLTQ